MSVVGVYDTRVEGGATQTVSSTTDTAKKTTAKTDPDKEWEKEAKSLLSDLNATPSDVIDFIKKSTKDGKLSEERALIIQEVLQAKRQISELFSNVMRTLADGANAIIRNIRA